MYVIEKLRLNKFQPSPVLTGRQLYAKFGYSDPRIQSKQTAEEIECVVPNGARKTQVLALANDMANKAAEFAENPNADPLPYRNPNEV